ncbi:RusA family crossover junction endodeoxyribonuclease [Aneurinibacillus thermoaerophilus]|uniref:RusA family crossover junction endodeoxyribonuclease n=1 Tax=Aneurinibacillus thermoaerophilus TaxID=143495 RepID=UPI002E1AB450|nr:RusA family crossover junction endodeoxyribonuclease [Aneurinibacillus thermoaerophilus]
MIRLVVPGRPVPAVRMTQRSKFVNKQAQRYLEYKNYVGWLAKAEKIKRAEGLVEVKAIAYLHGLREPDADNLAKAYLDALNGIAWVDDRQVRKLTIEKVKVDTAKEQRSEIEIYEVKKA